ncbi:MAG: ACP S-malonyltransferase [Candidatus Bipolaricaulota bacterium]|nr:ACP S-malonyltransferase [Candidatus Bipolaricaulota bacterium]MDW8127104.1 ACP S-malonyltransferase [Candidatus Bipolaricaulota bacterium]
MVAFLFPGQGSHEVGMGLDLFRQSEGQEVLSAAAELGWRKRVPELTGEELSRTALAQPAIFLVEWAGFLVARKKAKPEAVAGHSLGEFAALAAAEVLDWPTAFRLVLLRGALMEEAAQKQPGGMLAVLGLPFPTAEALAKEARCFVANINAPGQVILAGDREALSRAEELARKSGGKTVRLPVAGAFHSPFMAEAAQRFAHALAEVKFRPPKIPFVSSSSGKVERFPERIKEIIKQQMISCVRWLEATESLASLGVDEAWEIGPGQVLTRLGRRITSRIRFRALAEVVGDV